MAQINELKGMPVTKEQADDFVNNYKSGDPIPKEYVDYAIILLDERIAQMKSFNDEIRRALNLR